MSYETRNHHRKRVGCKKVNDKKVSHQNLRQGRESQGCSFFGSRGMVKMHEVGLEFCFISALRRSSRTAAARGPNNSLKWILIEET